MSSIKYYQLKEDEELPDEFCAVKDVNGEPSEYTFYRPETENAKLRIFAKLMHGHIKECCDACGERGICDVDALARELGIEVD